MRLHVSLPRAKSLLLALAVHACLFTILVHGQDCSATNPCALGYCSKFGFCGFGVNYCAPDVCVNNFDRKADCDPGGYGAAYVNHTTCPLNVCCSKWGFCGMTKDFCGDKPVKSPNCQGQPKIFQRVVGYYESWAMGRLCNAINPERIPLGVYTHLNFAFATIDPVTFEVKPAEQRDAALYQRLVALKGSDPNLKVFIAIGGWTFNDPGPTATTFSDIVGSVENSNKFITSLISFMSKYGFDGVDLDWEYPVAEDRSGRGADYVNFPLFLSRLKAALMLTPSRNGLSITIPASYWYLQHFDIKEIQKHIQFINVMSYDLHGTWDLTNKWVGPYLNAHTNLTEISDALDLLWRNDIEPEKVVLGLGFYGRTFRASSPACLAPGCRYASGAPAQDCSREVGIIMNSEIDDIIQKTGNSPILHQDAAIKVLTWDSDNWVAYDDADTLNMKTKFARDKCLGGVMVWAVSHDTKDGKFSNALSLAAPIAGSLLRKQTDGTTKAYDSHEQCKWTNCGETCPPGWVTVPRGDTDARPGEIMLDDQGCEGHGTHTYCCPVGGGVPSCGWYGHNNGNCVPSCPPDWKEVGSNNLHCNKLGQNTVSKGYQAACCSTVIGTGSHRVKPKNMQLQSQCGWGSWPSCGGSCTGSTPDLVSMSDYGSGGSFCHVGGSRTFCCDNDDPDWSYSSCSWHTTLGDGPDGGGACKSGCPGNTVRVAMSQTGCSRGAQAHCCSATARTLSKRSNPMLLSWASSLASFLRDPVCPADISSEPGTLDRRTSSPLSPPLFSREADRRVIKDVLDVTDFISQPLGVDTELISLWDGIVPKQFPYLTSAGVSNWLRNDPY